MGSPAVTTADLIERARVLDSTLLTDTDIHYFREGTHARWYEKLGCCLRNHSLNGGTMINRHRTMINRHRNPRLIGKAGMQAAVALTFVVNGISFAGTAIAQQTPAVQHSGKVTFVSGGIGLEQRAMLSQNEKDSNLKLVFTEPQGSYLSDIGVTVTDRKGSVVLETSAAGPWLLARLEPGSYKVTVTDSQGRQERMVNVGRDLRTVHFRLTAQAGIPGRPDS